MCPPLVALPQPLVEKVFSVYMTQTGSTRRFPYRRGPSRSTASNPGHCPPPPGDTRQEGAGFQLQSDLFVLFKSHPPPPGGGFGRRPPQEFFLDILFNFGGDNDWEWLSKKWIEVFLEGQVEMTPHPGGGSARPRFVEGVGRCSILDFLRFYQPKVSPLDPGGLSSRSQILKLHLILHLHVSSENVGPNMKEGAGPRERGKHKCFFCIFLYVF